MTCTHGSIDWKADPPQCRDCYESFYDKVECGRCMDIVPSLNADGMCDGCVEETND